MAQILGQELNSTLSTGGITQNNVDNLHNSKLHNEYSLNGNPFIPSKPTPSELDLNGQIPEQYINNTPD